MATPCIARRGAARPSSRLLCGAAARRPAHLAAVVRRQSAGNKRISLHGGALALRASVAGEFEEYVLDLQERICNNAAEMEGIGRTFEVDRWDRGEGGAGGYGITRVLQTTEFDSPPEGALYEKAAANVSVVKGNLTPERAKAMSSRGRDIDIEGGQPYSAAAMSLVFHPASPMVPTLRADVRLFEVGGMTWYGGGCDLTPAYLFEEDAVEFHEFWKGVCDKYDAALYPKYKKWCDDYFYIPARKEHRGVGGLFFDDLSPEDVGFDVSSFVKEVGDGILPSWEGTVARRRGDDWGQEERRWQCLRRGRYLEFNLLYDRGVKFGLDGGRVESIMVSARCVKALLGAGADARARTREGDTALDLAVSVRVAGGGKEDEDDDTIRALKGAGGK